MTSDPHAQAIATLRDDIRQLPPGRIEAARAALAILERPQALEGESIHHDILVDLDVQESITDAKVREWLGEAQVLLTQTMEGPYSVIVALAEHALAQSATISDLQRRLGEAEAAKVSALAGCNRHLSICERGKAVIRKQRDEAFSALASAREENGKLRDALQRASRDFLHAQLQLPPSYRQADAVRAFDDAITNIRAVLASTASPETDSGTPPAGGGTVVTEAPKITQAMVEAAKDYAWKLGEIDLPYEWAEAILRAALVLQPGEVRNA